MRVLKKAKVRAPQKPRAWPAGEPAQDVFARPVPKRNATQQIAAMLGSESIANSVAVL